MKSLIHAEYPYYIDTSISHSSNLGFPSLVSSINSELFRIKKRLILAQESCVTTLVYFCSAFVECLLDIVFVCFRFVVCLFIFLHKRVAD